MTRIDWKTQEIVVTNHETGEERYRVPLDPGCANEIDAQRQIIRDGLKRMAEANPFFTNKPKDEE